MGQGGLKRIWSDDPGESAGTAADPEAQQRRLLMHMEQDEYYYSSSDDGEDPRGRVKRTPGLPVSVWDRALALKPCSTTTMIGSITFVLLVYWALFASSSPVHPRQAPTSFSPPWYPAPLGGTVRSWEESYRKSAALVSQMTLMEKGMLESTNNKS